MMNEQTKVDPSNLVKQRIIFKGRGERKEKSNRLFLIQSIFLYKILQKHL